MNSELVLAAAVHPADTSDSTTLVGSVVEAQANLVLAGSEPEIEEVVADKLQAWRQATLRNRRRVKGRRRKRLHRLRSELVERSFSQVCVTEGGRRT